MCTYNWNSNRIPVYEDFSATAKHVHSFLFILLIRCFVFSEAQAEREAVCHETCSAGETRSEEEGSRAISCGSRETAEQHAHSAGGAAAGDALQGQTGKCVAPSWHDA